ncbi:MAG: Pyruvate, phosphate dikinase [Candidatus Shapirobacteria bacterium GW2011_GWF1_38_23]|nr:MAG: Pyruvate, phosphate dikinase [Candidatus Shapirobacteria bacterium GW2011_GWF1_38_23]
MKYILGGKGANLAEMSKLGIPVPPGFTLSTEVCKEFNDNGQKYPATLKKEVEQNLAKLESATGKKFGDTKNPLLVSVRSGAASSMPGMMDTILNLGLNEDVVNSISASTGNPRFAWDSYRRFVQMYSNVVENIEHEKLEAVIDEIKDSRGIKQDTDMTATDWQEVVKAYKKLFKIEKNRDWNNPRAITYRRLNHIDENKVFGTAINIQSMVFGNLGADSGTGVAFTRNPATGENLPYGEYLMNAQGEDVVAGIRTPKHLDSLKEDNEVIYKELINIFSKLEKHYRDMQDVEFTIENGRLYILQTRNGKRTAPASVKIAVDLVKEKMISQKEAILRVEPEKLEQLLHPTLDPKAKSQFKIIASGLPASPGAGVGQVVFNADTAVEWKEKGNKVILVRAETSPEDISGMNAAQGILTARGGMTSHAAVVARGMGKCCVSGCESIIVSEIEKKFRVGDLVVSEGDLITLDGSTGEVFLGEVPTINPQLSGYFGTIMEWSDKYKKLGVRTNADTPKDAAVARDFGAKGIGLCRTEHMFFEADRIFAVRQMIVSETVEQRKAALAKIFPMQKNDFKELFQIMKGFPVKIRLLDPPLHEFLPKTEAEIEAIAKEMGISASKLSQKVDYLHELNPMMGHRGCRLGVTFPEIFEMQVEAIAQAACELVKAGESIVPEIMIPLVGEFNELKWLKDRLVPIIEATIKKHGVKMTYEIGTMIEIPRAALTADTIATEADFFSFGTNDLTQMTYGFSRDDAGKFLKDYLDKKILPEDPFKSLDTIGVGKLMKMAVELGRASKKNLHIGICGEQGGDPATIKFCHEIGLDYVSCSPYRVPIARLAAAQAAIEGEK